MSGQVPAKDALWGLLHDAAEAYLSDIVRPVKRLVAFCDFDQVFQRSYDVVENEILTIIAERFGCDGSMPDSVKDADLRALATERDQLFSDHTSHWHDLDKIKPYKLTLMGLPPGRAKISFMKRFEELSARKES
jgi:uncharacterized protein